MSRFAFRSEVVDVRGVSVTVRELTFRQKADWAKRATEDPLCAPYVLLSLVMDPPVDAEEAAEWPADVVEDLVEVARRVSGMDKREADTKND